MRGMDTIRKRAGPSKGPVLAETCTLTWFVQLLCCLDMFMQILHPVL